MKTTEIQYADEAKRAASLGAGPTHDLKIAASPQ
jgi:hypothetical protein